MLITPLYLRRSESVKSLTGGSTYSVFNMGRSNKRLTRIKNFLKHVPFLSKSGLRLKTLAVFNCTLNNLLLDVSSLGGRVLRGRQSSITLFAEKSVDSVSFTGFPLYIRVVRSNRKVIKYSKGKLRYRNYLAKIRTRNEVGLFFRLWKISTLMNDELSNDNSYLKYSYLFFSNLSKPGLDNPHTIQMAMIKKYVESLKKRLKWK